MRRFHVSLRIIVSANHHDARMMALGFLNQPMQVFKIMVIVRQNSPRFLNGKSEMNRIFGTGKAKVYR